MILFLILMFLKIDDCLLEQINIQIVRYVQLVVERAIGEELVAIMSTASLYVVLQKLICFIIGKKATKALHSFFNKISDISINIIRNILRFSLLAILLLCIFAIIIYPPQ